MASELPRVYKGILQIPDGTVISIGTTEWFGWLDDPAVRSFRFDDEQAFTCRKEKVKGRDGYWYGYRNIESKTRSRYIGKSLALTESKLLEVAQLFEGMTLPPPPLPNSIDNPVALPNNDNLQLPISIGDALSERLGEPSSAVIGNPANAKPLPSAITELGKPEPSPTADGTDELTDRLADLEQRLTARFEQRVAKLEQKLNAVANTRLGELYTLRAENESLKQTLKKAQDRIKSLNDAVDQKDKLVAQHYQDKVATERLADQKSDAERERDALQLSNVELTQQLSVATAEIGELRQQIVVGNAEVEQLRKPSVPEPTAPMSDDLPNLEVIRDRVLMSLKPATRKEAAKLISRFIAEVQFPKA